MESMEPICIPSEHILIQKTRCDFLQGSEDERAGDIFDAIIATNKNVANMSAWNNRQQQEIDAIDKRQDKLESKFVRVLGITAGISAVAGIIVSMIT